MIDDTYDKRTLENTSFFFESYRDPISFGNVIRGGRREDNRLISTFEVIENPRISGEQSKPFTVLNDEVGNRFYVSLMDCLWGMGYRPSKKALKEHYKNLVANELYELHKDE